MYFRMPTSSIAASLRAHSVDKEALETLLDKLEEGQFCDCFTGQQQEVRLLNEHPHKIDCIGKVKVSEILYEEKWQNTILIK